LRGRCRCKQAVVARLDRAIQYALTPILIKNGSGILDHPLSRMMTIEFDGKV